MLKYFALIREKKDKNQSMTKVEKILWLKINKGMDSKEALETLENTNNFFDGTWQEHAFNLPVLPKKEEQEKPIEIDPEFNECRRKDIPNLVMHFFKAQESTITDKTKYYRAWNHKKHHAIFKLDTGETCIFENSGIRPSWAECSPEEIIEAEPIIPPIQPTPQPISIPEIPYYTPEIEMMTGVTPVGVEPEITQCNEFSECAVTDVPALVMHHFTAQECPITERTKFYRIWDHERQHAVYRLCSGETCVFENAGVKPFWAHYSQ